MRVSREHGFALITTGVLALGLATYAADAAADAGNGRRLVAVVINNGHPEYRVLGVGLFYLLPAAQYSGGGNDPFCAEYVGPYVQGARQRGAGESGAYSVRLVE